MHVLMTVNAAWNILNFRRALVEALLADGHRVTALAPIDPSINRLRELGLQFVPLTMDIRGVNPWHDLRLIGELQRHFREQSPDAVLSFTIKNNIFGAIAARRAGIPFVPNVTGLGTAFLSTGIMRMAAEGLYRHAFRHLDYVLFQNEDDRSLFVQRALVTRRQATLLPGSGIDLAHFALVPLPSADRAPIMLMVARLLRDKGTFEFVEAARQVRRSRPDVRFQLLGTMDAKNRTAIGADHVAAWQAEGVIEYLGQVDDVRPLIAQATCVVLPSYREGAPRTLMEAAAMGRPLIATDVPGCRSVVEHGVSGFLCKPRSADDLATSFLELLALSSERRQSMGFAGRKKMEHEFDQARVVATYRQIIADYGQRVERGRTHFIMQLASPHTPTVATERPRTASASARSKL